MEHLTRLDASFIEAEDSDRHVSLAIGALAVLEGPLPDYDSFVEGLSERLQNVPRFRQVLRRHPFDLTAPDWVDDTNLDLTHHVHRAALPQPGDDEALFRLAADVMERRLDRDRPLWECWMIEGLPDGHWAVLTKIHHCIADGIATTHLLEKLCDEHPSETFATDIRAAHEPAKGNASLPKFSLNPADWAGGAWQASVAAASSVRQVWDGAVSIAGDLLQPAAPSSLTGPVSTMRRYAATQVPLEDVTAVCTAFDVTINDVALAAITDSFRSTLIRRGEQPRRNSVRTLVPVSVRSNDAVDRIDNQVSLMLPYLPVDKAGPVAQLRAVHKRLNKAKGSGQREAGSTFVSAADVVPFVVAAWALRGLTRLPQRGVVTVTTNVPGPRHRLRIMDREVLKMLPIPPIALGLRTGIAIFSYADQLTFGVTGDYDTAPDVVEFTQGIAHAVTRLVAASDRRNRRAAAIS